MHHDDNAERLMRFSDIAQKHVPVLKQAKLPFCLRQTFGGHMEYAEYHEGATPLPHDDDDNDQETNDVPYYSMEELEAYHAQLYRERRACFADILLP